MAKGDGPGADLEALEKDCRVEFTRGSGPGGQHRNKVETVVRLTHLPTGIVVTGSEHRSQARNRQAALERLAKKLAEREEERRRAQRRAARKKTKPSRAARQRRLDAKRRQADKKQTRRRVAPPSSD